MIRTLSPYYKVTPFVSPLTSAVCSKYILEVYIWSGLKSAVPATPTYSIEKENLSTSSGSDSVNIARLIDDYIEIMPQAMTVTGVYNGANQVWVRTQVIYTTTDPADLDVAQIIETDLAVKGYAYGMEGANLSSPTNRILLSGSEFKVSNTGYFILPVLVSETLTYPVSVISHPDNNLNYSTTIAATTTSGELVKAIVVNAAQASTDTSIEIIFNSETITLYLEDECRYTPIDIAFLNKDGAIQIVTFFKARTDKLSVDKETFQGDSGQPNLGYHQYSDFNIQGRSNFKVNTGFVDESMNETFRQLLLSSKVWQYSSSIYTPLNVASKSFEYKSRQKDRMINYEIEFEYSFNEINDI